MTKAEYTTHDQTHAPPSFPPSIKPSFLIVLLLLLLLLFILLLISTSFIPSIYEVPLFNDVRSIRRWRWAITNEGLVSRGTDELNPPLVSTSCTVYCPNNNWKAERKEKGQQPRMNNKLFWFHQLGNWGVDYSQTANGRMDGWGILRRHPKQWNERGIPRRHRRSAYLLVRPTLQAFECQHPCSDLHKEDNTHTQHQQPITDVWKSVTDNRRRRMIPQYKSLPYVNKVPLLLT